MPAKKKEIGVIEHYFSNIGVAVIQLKGTLKVGDKISIEGATTNITQEVDSIQIDRKPVEEAKKGQAIGIKVSDKVRANDLVFLI
ncbi:MAG: U32 family peptidase C-terminal domain-containing protein [Candidatus Nanoarchaeia archaeon]